MTLIRTSCPGRRYDIEICRSFANCSSRVNMVKQSNAFITVAKSTMKTPSTSSCQEKPCQTPSLISSATPKASLSYTRATASRAVSQSAMSNHLVVDDINTKTISKMVLPVTAKMSSPTSSLTTGGIFAERGENDVLVTRGMGFSTPVETFIRMTPSTTLTASTAVPSITQSPFTSLSSTAFSLSLSTSSSSTGFLASSSSSSSSSSLSPSTLPSSTAFSSSSSSQSFLSSSSPLASASSSTSKPSPSTSLPSIPTSASASTFSLLSPSPSSPSSSSSSSLPTSSSIMSQPVSCVSCVYAATKSSTHSKASSDHPLPTRSYQMTSLEPSLSTTVIQTPKLSTSSPSMQDTIKTPSVQKPRTSSSFGGRFEAVTMSKVYTSNMTSIEPSRTSVVTTQESSTRIVQGHSNSCSRCRTSEKKQKLFCKGDYAIHVQVRNGSTTLNNKTVYHLLVQNIYKSNLPLSRDLFIRVTGVQCPCPWLQTGKEYLVIGRARRTKKEYSKIIIHRRSFVEEWSGSVNSEVEVLRNRCVALGFNVSSSYLKTVDLKRTNNGENNSSVAEGPSVIPTTGKPSTSMSTLPTTIINKYSDCPPCILSVNSSIGALYCTSEYAIRARITKYRKATNRTMFYAHLITTYKTTSKLPIEVLIRVPGEKCPCPRLVPGVEYLMIGKTKLTLNGKRRLTLSVESFYAKWRDEFEKEIDITKTRCGLPLVTSQPDDNSTVASHQSTTTTAPTVNPTIMPTTAQSNSSCPSCDQSTVAQNQQKRFCKNENVFRGRVTKSIPTATNRTLYYITMVASFKTNFKMPDKIVARLSDNSCQCSHLTVGKDYLIMGQVKLNKKGKGRVVLTKKSFVQDWNPDFIQKIDQLKAKCGLPVVNNKSGPSTERSGTPLGKTPTPSKAVKPTTVAKVTRNEACPPCRVSANIHDFCSNDYVFRGRVLKGYRTSANRTVYHVSLTTSYKSLANLTSVILVRIPGVSCPCPQLQVGVQYVFMGWVRVKRKSVSTIALNPKNFAQKWDEGFEEELSSIRSSCKKSLVVDGPLVQSVSAKKDKTLPTTGITPQSFTASVTTSTIRTTTQAPLPTASLNLTGTIEKRCAPICQTSRKRNQLYCASDYVVTVEIEKKEHNPVTQNTKYFAAVKYTFKQKDPLELMVILWVLNNECNCPNLQLNHSYVVMVNSDFGENGIERLVMSERSFIKKWTKGLQRRISKLRNNCNTDHKGRY